MKLRRGHAALVVVVALLSGCDGDGAPAASPADLVVTNGRVFTSNAATPWAEAVAVEDGRFTFVGSAADAEAYVGPDTQRHDLGGRLVVSGIIDAHTHPGLVSVLGDGDLGTEPETGEPSCPGSRRWACVPRPPFPASCRE